jgi:hypothetical protein
VAKSKRASRDGLAALTGGDLGDSNGEHTAIEKLDRSAEFANAILPPDIELGSKAKVALVMDYTSAGIDGQLVVTSVPLGDDGAVFITAPFSVQGEKLVPLLKNKGIDLAAISPELGSFVNDISVSLDAFYYGAGKDDPVLVSMNATFKEGLIDSLVNPKPVPEVTKPTDAARYDSLPPAEQEQTDYGKYKKKKDAWDKRVRVDEIFDVKKVSIRFVKGGAPNSKETLRNYVAKLKH